MIYTQETNALPLTVSKKYLAERKSRSFYSVIRNSAETLGMGIISLDLAVLSTYSVVMFYVAQFFASNMVIAVILPAVILAPSALLFAGYTVMKGNEAYKAYIDYKQDSEMVVKAEIRAKNLDENSKTEMELHNLVEVISKRLEEKDEAERNKYLGEEKIYLGRLLEKFSSMPKNKIEAVKEDKVPYLNLYPYSKAYLDERKKGDNISSIFKYVKAVPFVAFSIFSGVGAGFMISSVVNGLLENAIYSSSAVIFALGAISLLACTGKLIYEGYAKRKAASFYDDIAKNVELVSDKGDKDNLDLQTEYNKMIVNATKGNDLLRREVVKSFVDYVNATKEGVQQQVV